MSRFSGLQAIQRFAFPEKIKTPVTVLKRVSCLQLRDSTGFAPVYLLSVNTPDTLLFSFSLVRFLNFIAIYHAVFAVPQRGKYLHVKLSKLLIMYIGFFLILQ